MKRSILLLVCCLGLAATVGDDASTLSLVHEVLDPDVKHGFTAREDTWHGDLPVGEPKIIAHQLFAGNDYRFYLGTKVKGARVAVHIYDHDGNLAENDAWQRPPARGDGYFAVAGLRPRRTGTYHLMVTVEQSPEARTAWGLVYAYK